MQDFNQAAAYITALTGSPDSVCEFRAIHDTDKGVPAIPRRGVLSALWPELIHWNNQGYGIFCTVSAMDHTGERKLENVAHVRAHFVDLDGVDAPARYAEAVAWQPAASFAVFTSPSKAHVYWCVSPYLDLARFSTVQRKLRQMFSGDKSVTDATRVMRLPGTLHCKGESYLVTCAALVGYGQPLTVDALEAALTHVQVFDTADGTRHPLGTESLSAPSLAWLQRAMEMIDPNSLSRGEWVSYLAAFKQAGWCLTDPVTLKQMVFDWCARYEGNDLAENEKQYESLRETEVGWPNIERRVPSLKLMGYVPQPPVAVAAATPQPVMVMPEPPPLGDTSGEFLDMYGQQQWFKGCVAIERTGEILTPTGRYMKPAQFNVRYGGKKFIIDSTGKATDEPWKAATRSTMWTVPKADHIRFLPDHEFGEIITDQLGRRGVNTYVPVQIARQAGDASPFVNHIAAMIPDEGDRRILFDFWAHNIKFPGYKIPWAPLIQSTEGTGKGFIQETLERILGDMYVYSPKAQELVKSGSTFNSWMRAKLMIVVNEIKIDERRELIEILKPMITDKRVEIQAKGVDQEMEDNCANWQFFSNFKDAIPVNKNGRRYAVFYSALQSKDDLMRRGMDDRYYASLFNWLRTGGSEIVADWFMNYPIERGMIPGKAPETTSMSEALVLSQGPIERLVIDAVADGLAGFRGGWVSLTALVNLMRERQMRQVSQNVLEGILISLGYRAVGRAVRPYFAEDRNSRSHLFALDGSADVAQFGRVQGYE